LTLEVSPNRRLTVTHLRSYVGATLRRPVGTILTLESCAYRKTCSLPGTFDRLRLKKVKRAWISPPRFRVLYLVCTVECDEVEQGFRSASRQHASQEILRTFENGSIGDFRLDSGATLTCKVRMRRKCFSARK